MRATKESRKDKFQKSIPMTQLSNASLSFEQKSIRRLRRLSIDPPPQVPPNPYSML